MWSSPLRRAVQLEQENLEDVADRGVEGDVDRGRRRRSGRRRRGRQERGQRKVSQSDHTLLVEIKAETD